ncbi:MAG: hypothetical protein AB7G93_05610 [Bdellovibrionales bacterium]
MKWRFTSEDVIEPRGFFFYKPNNGKYEPPPQISYISLGYTDPMKTMLNLSGGTIYGNTVALPAVLIGQNFNVYITYWPSTTVATPRRATRVACEIPDRCGWNGLSYNCTSVVGTTPALEYKEVMTSQISVQFTDERGIIAQFDGSDVFTSDSKYENVSRAIEDCRPNVPRH